MEVVVSAMIVNQFEVKKMEWGLAGFRGHLGCIASWLGGLGSGEALRRVFGHIFRL